MNCREFDEVTEVYAAGELAGEALAESEAHLAGCAACRERLEAARRQLRALDAALAGQRVADDFVERTMARVRAEAAPAHAEAKDERPEPLRHRVLRYAALAAAAALLAMAGYSFLRRSSGAWLERGAVAVMGPNARPLGPGSRLAAGDVLATPASGAATLALDGGRLRVALAPLTTVRVMDPTSGTALQLVRGEAYCRGSGGEGTPYVACPLANVAAGPGIVSLHVTPEQRGAADAQPFQGMVTLAAHDGGARVVVPGRQMAAVPLERGQVLTLSSDPRRSFAVPIPIERLRQTTAAELRAVKTRHGELELRWAALMGGRHAGLSGERAPFFLRAGELQDALGQTSMLHAELQRRLELLNRCQAEGQQAFRLVIQPAPRPR